jgi:rubredoxin
MKHKCRKCGTIFDLAGKVIPSPLNLPRVLQEKRELKRERIEEGKVISTPSEIIKEANPMKISDIINKILRRDRIGQLQKGYQKETEEEEKGFNKDILRTYERNVIDIPLQRAREKEKEAEEELKIERGKEKLLKRGYEETPKGYKETKKQIYATGGNFVKCPDCAQEGKEIWINLDGDRTCPDCGHVFNPNTGKVTRKAKPLHHEAGRKIKGKVYDIFIYEIAGIAALLTPSFFGLPSLMYIAIALMVFAPLHVFIPSERELLGSAEIREGMTTELGASSAVFLMLKSGSKMIAAGLIIANLFMLNRLLALAFAFAFYFTLKTRYKTSQPYRMIEAWARLFVGILLAYFFYVTFGGSFNPLALLSGGGGNPVAVSLFWMGLAFFATLPIHIEDTEEGKFQVSILKGYKNLTESGSFQALERILFAIAMLISLFSFLMPVGGFGGMMGGNATQIMFFAVWALSFFVGLFSGPEGRPAIGILMIAVSLFAFSSSYTGYVGQAIFGYWWPQVQSFGETYMAPLGNAWGQAQSAMGDAWCMLTNPAQCYLMMQQRQQATASVLMTGGSSSSIEVNKFDLSTSIAGTLEPSEPIMGYIELQNRGDFDSNHINLKLWSVWQNATTGQVLQVGSFGSMTCSGPGATTAEGQIGSCDWSGTIYPQEMKTAAFRLNANSWDILGTQCNDNNGACTCFVDCAAGNATYAYGSQTVKVNANLTFNYNVNVSVPINIINESVYFRKVQNNLITLQDINSEYTGGPIKATLWTVKQPLRTSEPSLIVASIYNDGSGNLLKINSFTIKIYSDGSISSVNKIASTFRTSPTGDGCPQSFNGSADGIYTITCNNTYGIIGPGTFKRLSFTITPSPSVEDTKTTLIVGLANYDYIKTTSQMLQIANAPPQ